jgi:hypothetical protein
MSFSLSTEEQRVLIGDDFDEKQAIYNASKTKIVNLENQRYSSLYCGNSIDSSYGNKNFIYYRNRFNQKVGEFTFDSRDTCRKVQHCLFDLGTVYIEVDRTSKEIFSVSIDDKCVNDHWL